jgi:PPOX class probable F420-dependent enzyme
LLNDAARALPESDALAHLVTIAADGSPQISLVWVGLDGDDIVFSSLGPRRKLDNIARDPRVSLSMEGTGTNAMGLREYLVVHGTARIVEGGGPELLQRLAHTYLGPGVKFPPMDDPPPGVVVHIRADRVGGVGPWA